MRVFLTGVNGYLGSVLARHLALLPQVEGITGIDIAPPQSALPDKVQFVQRDIRSPDLAEIMAGHDIVIHTAFIVLWKAQLSASDRDDINFNGVRNVARAALANSVHRFVQASSVAAYDTTSRPEQGVVMEDFPLGRGDSFWYYANGKAMAERTLLEVLGNSPIVLTCLRPTFIVGPCNRDTIPSLRANAIRVPSSDPIAQWVHEDDVAAAFVQATLQDMPGGYNVVPDDALPISEVMRIIGVESPRTVPMWLARLVVDFQWRFLGGQTHPSWVGAMWGGDNRTYSNAKLRATGWQPRYSSAETLRDSL